MNLTSPSEIRALLSRHDVKLSKALGQNFIINPGICPKIAESGGASPGVGVLEIGPGIGVLTKELAKTAGKVVSIELDRRLLPVLDETLAELDNVKIIHGDVLKLDLAGIIAEQFPGMDAVVCANLPYYITSPVIMRLLEERLPIKSITVMVQKEAAQRLCAEMPSRQAGAVTAAVAYFSRAAMLFTVSRGSFMPAPKVDSAVIRLDIREKPAVDIEAEALFFRIIKAAFGQRRKTLANCLSSGLAMQKGDIVRALEHAGIQPETRAEQLSMEQFGRLCGEIARFAVCGECEM